MNLSKLSSTFCTLSLFIFIQPAIAITSARLLSPSIASKPNYLPIAFKSENKLPKVGFVKSSERGVGCYYSFAQDKRKKYIFVNASGTTMNFDGQDIDLVRISGKSKKSFNIDDYTANNLKIRVVSIHSNKMDYALKGAITIKNGSNSKVIKFDGYCDD